MQYFLLQHRGLVDLGVEQFILYIVKSQTVHRIREALAGDTLVPEEQDGPLYGIQWAAVPTTA